MTSDLLADYNVSHKILPNGTIQIIPIENSSFLNQFAKYLDEHLNIKIIIDYSILKKANAGVRSQQHVSESHNIFTKGIFYIPLETILEPFSISPDFMHEQTHIIKLFLNAKKTPHILSGRIESFRSNATSNSAVPTPSYGIAYKDKEVYRSPYSFSYSFDELEAHFKQAQTYFAMDKYPPVEVLFSGLIIADQLFYLTNLALNYDSSMVPRSVGWQKFRGPTGTAYFDFGPGFGALMLSFSLLESFPTKSSYKNPSYQDKILMVNKKIEELRRVVNLRRNDFLIMLSMMNVNVRELSFLSIQQK